MASQSGNNDAGTSGQGISSELRARDLPSKRLLGKGLASIAYETEWNGERFARKDFIGVPSGTFQKEADDLVGLKHHKNVVNTYGRTVDEVSCSLVLEYMEDDLLDLLQKRKESQGRLTGTTSGNQSKQSHFYPFELLEVLGIILQISRGMKFLHDHNILHGDLKTKNVLVTHANDGDKNSLSVKVADFGLVRTKSKSMSFVSRQARKLDVVQWKAPEILERLLSEDNGETSSESDSNSDEECIVSAGVTENPAFAADVYSFALTCSQILTGEDPYPNRNWKELGAKIISGELRPNLPAKCPTILEELLLRCWKRDSAQRPTFSNICTTLELLHNPQMNTIEKNTVQRTEELAPLAKRPQPTKHPISAEKSGDITEGFVELFQSRRNERHATDVTQLPKYHLEVQLCCARCEQNIIKEIEGVVGVIDVRVEREMNKVVVVSSPSGLDEHQLLRRAKKFDKKAKFVEVDAEDEMGEAESMRASKPSHWDRQYQPAPYTPGGYRLGQNYSFYGRRDRPNATSLYNYPPLSGEYRPRPNFDASYYYDDHYSRPLPGEDGPNRYYSSYYGNSPLPGEDGPNRYYSSYYGRSPLPGQPLPSLPLPRPASGDEFQRYT